MWYVTLHMHIDNCIIESTAQEPYCGGTNTPLKTSGVRLVLPSICFFKHIFYIL